VFGGAKLIESKIRENNRVPSDIKKPCDIIISKSIFSSNIILDPNIAFNHDEDELYNMLPTDTCIFGSEKQIPG
jgi:hypothetical protein